MPTYDEFVFKEAPELGEAWLEANPQEQLSARFLFEKIGDMCWRRLVDKKSMQQILFEITGKHPDPPAVPIGAVPRLHVEGTRFVTSDGQLFQWRGFSFFLGYRRFLAGDDLRPDLAVLRAHKVNLLRVFGPLPWKETPDYRQEGFNFDRLGEFFTFLASEGFYCEWVPICYAFDLVSQREVVKQSYRIAKDHPNVLIEIANEPHVNKTNPVKIADGIDRFGVVSAYGIYGPYYTSADDPLPTLDYCTLHTQRDSAWHRKARHAQELQAKLRKPCISDEPAKGIELDFDYPGGKKVVHEFAWHHGVCSLWTPGSTLHTEEGKWGRVPTPGMLQFEMLQAVASVWENIGPEWQTGAYAGAHSSGSPVDGDGLQINGQDVWTYSSVHSNKAMSVRCALSEPKAIRGWRVVRAVGPSNCIVQTER